MSSTSEKDLAEEQEFVTRAYDRLDDLRDQAQGRLAATLLDGGGSTQNRGERDSNANMYAEQVAQLDAVENGLCFGRLDREDGEIVHIGRIGLSDEEFEPILIDWRAPIARPFYLATAASPEGVRRRRHIRTQRREVAELDDEILDLEQAGGQPSSLAGEATLLAALGSARTGRMRDIVETIQAEQDHIIRADPNGVLVVQGGPGTGKTAVALHRAAYLLYTYRQQLATRGVLIVGPNQTFLRYISQVLPSLAETGVLLRTVGDLFPGVRARRTEPDAVAEIKGRSVMAEVLAAAVADRQRVPDEAIEIEVDHQVLRLDRAICEVARARARASGRAHNLARPVFARLILDELTTQLAEAIGTDPYALDPLGGDDAPGDTLLLGAADLADIRAELVAEPAIITLLDWLWPQLTPQRLLTELLADADALDRVAAGLLPAADRAALVREPGGWTAADAPLLDEAAELLGEDDTLAQARLEAARRERVAYAEGALEIFEGSRSQEFEDWSGVGRDSEQLLATDLLSADVLAARQEEGSFLTTAQRAAQDRLWAFGHIIVDEAQELSPMAWRLLMRRSPSRSMTIVGDTYQTGDLSGTRSWAAVLSPYVEDRWRLAELTVNYRTPAEIMELAAGVLAGIDPAARPPRSVRATGVPPWSASGPLPQALLDAVAAEVSRIGDGRLGVIVPTALLGELAHAVMTAFPGDTIDALESRVVVLTTRAAKGLEFDSVIVVAPSQIVAESPRGANDLYVALTRATQRLGTLAV